MPNWCTNKLTITGEPVDLDAFVKDHNPFSFQVVTPMPEEVTKTDAWYDWAVSNWGTKWDSRDDELTRVDPTTAVVQFNTAWSPPIVWLAAAGKRYPLLSFTMNYSEEGMNFGGEAGAENGSLEVTDCSAIAAQIKMFGKYTTLCNNCDAEFTITNENTDTAFCPKCAATRCKNCQHWDDHHVNGQCLYGPSKYLATAPDYKGPA